ncbi:hypothetical protein ACFE04_025959 [Oxalis oulophora]
MEKYRTTIEEKEEEEKKQTSSYRYWVRESTVDSAPPPVPKKLTSDDIHNLSNQTKSSINLGSAWNSAGTWEEKNLNKWATNRIKELLHSLGSLEFSSGNAEITHVTKCDGDASLVTVRNKKRVGYTYELTLKVKGEWMIKDEKKTVKANIDITEFSFGELDDLEMEIKLTEDNDLMKQDKVQINNDLKQFLQPVREKLQQFEAELKDR